MKVTVRIEGGEELQRQLRRLKDEVNEVLDEAALAGGEVIRDAARSRAPGPHVEMEVVEKTKLGAEVAIGPDDEHWHYRFAETGAAPHEIDGHTKKALEFLGDEGMLVTGSVEHPGRPAEPFLRPAIDEKKDEAQRAVGEVLRRRIEQVAE